MQRGERVGAVTCPAPGADGRSVESLVDEARRVVARAESRNREAALASINAVEIGEVRRACERFERSGDDEADQRRARELVQRANDAYAFADQSARRASLQTGKAVSALLGMFSRRS